LKPHNLPKSIRIWKPPSAFTTPLPTDNQLMGWCWQSIDPHLSPLTPGRAVVGLLATNSRHTDITAAKRQISR